MDKLKQKMSALTTARDEAIARVEEVQEEKKASDARAERVSLHVCTDLTVSLLTLFLTIKD